MGEVQFYYSAGGRETYGPVSKAMLHQLLRDNIVDSNYYFCREGEEEWRQLDPAVLEAEPELMLPDQEGAGPQAAERAPSLVDEKLDTIWSSWVDIMESSSMRFFLWGICLVIPLLIGFILTARYAQTLPQTDQSLGHLAPLTARFGEVLAAVALAVYLSGLPFPSAYRLWIRTSAMLFLGALVAFGLIP